VQLPVNRCNCKNSTKAYKRNSKRSSPAAISEVSAQITVLQAQQDKLEIDRQDYQQNLHACPKLFTLTSTPGISIWVQLPTRLQSILANVSGWVKPMPRLAAAIDVWQRQIPHLSGTIHAWWQWVLKLCSQTQDPDTQHWVLILLPWVYWHQQTERRHTELKQGYHQATQQAHARFLAHSFTHTETLAQQQQWIDWAIWMCASSTSSAVEGRNGYLVSIILIRASRNKP